MNDANLVSLANSFNLYSLFILIFATGTILAGFLIFFKKIFRWSTDFGNTISEIIKGSSISELGSDNPWASSAKAFYDLKVGIIQKENELNRLSKELSLSVQAKQVAHDIRSPLSALNMVTAMLKEIPETQRVLIRSATSRINDIANALLENSKKLEAKNQEKLREKHVGYLEEQMEPILLEPVIAAIISEKRIQNRDKKDLEINSDLRCGLDLFAMIKATEFGRLMSNLLNNSIEAMPKNKGLVTVRLGSHDNWIDIEISDNGLGIPSEILSRIGEQGFSYGKSIVNSGSGLGVFHAKSAIELAGGRFSILSQVGKGTKIVIELPKMLPPKWFVGKLVLSQNSLLISLDDDESIHQIWTKRLVDSGAQNVTHLIFQSCFEFEKWYLSERESNEGVNKMFFLIDFELVNQPLNGIELISKLGIAKQSILVTSRYDEATVRKKCDDLNLRIIPKAISGFMPIEIVD